MKRLAGKLLLISVLLLSARQANAEPLEYIGKPVRGIPVAQAVKVAKSVFVSGTPAFDGNGKLAVGDFPAQMKQVMDNMTATLKASGADWDRVVKTNILLIRSGDFPEMNRIYATYFPDGKYPARTTVVVAGLPHPDFLLEIECEAILEQCVRWHARPPWPSADPVYLGDQDDMVGRAAAEGMVEFIAAPYKFVVLPRVGYYAADRVPERVNRLLLAHLEHCPV